MWAGAVASVWPKLATDVVVDDMLDDDTAAIRMFQTPDPSIPLSLPRFSLSRDQVRHESS